MQKFRKTVSLSYFMTEAPDMGTRIIVFCGLRIEKSPLIITIRSGFSNNSLSYFCKKTHKIQNFLTS